MTRSLKAVALAALLALGSAAAITHTAGANGAQTGAYAVARAQTGGERSSMVIGRPGRSAAYIIEPNHCTLVDQDMCGA